MTLFINGGCAWGCWACCAVSACVRLTDVDLRPPCCASSATPTPSQPDADCCLGLDSADLAASARLRAGRLFKLTHNQMAESSWS